MSDKPDYQGALEDMVNQFAFEGTKDGRACLTTGGLGALEYAFDVLGYDDPHIVPWRECQWDGCHQHATSGTPTPDGYKRLCHEHYKEVNP